MLRRGGLATTALLALTLAAGAPAAHADVIHAESILPPGESGFVSTPGVADGTGSPHLYDQQQPFIDFRRKDDMLNLPAASTEQPRPGVKIDRDNFGVPSITAGNDADVWWGAGYATAQDRLFELEAFRRATTGHLAEILGKSYLPMDIETRRDYYTPSELDAMFHAVPQELQARYQSYLDGINAWVQEAQLDPSKMPGEFPATGDQLQPFTIDDLVAIGVYLARTTPNGDGNDLTNMKAVNQLGPQKFNQVLPLRIPGQISTVPAASGQFPSVPGRTTSDEQGALSRSADFVKGLPQPQGEQPSGSPDSNDAGTSGPLPIAPIKVGGSYMVARGDPKTHHAVFFNGPELGFSAPEELYELEVHRPGLDARGITAPGAPIIAIGHNQHVAWGLTSGLSQTNALYAEKLVPGQGEQYTQNGQTKTMSCRDETFQYRSSPTDLLSGKVPQLGSATYRLCRTDHGPVQARAGDVAYARRYATWDREVETIVGLSQVDEAKSVADVDKAAANLTWNENIMAADDQGHIGYWHPGLLPIRPKDWDERLPYPGTGEAEWTGFLPLSQRPHAIDPKQGWLANWNNIPSQGWTTGNDPASERVSGKFHRVGLLGDLVKKLLVRQPATFAHLQDVVHGAGTTAQQRLPAAPQLQAAANGATGPAAAVLQTILRWNGDYNTTDSNGTVDPGAAAWQEFKNQAQAIAIARLGPGAELIGSEQPGTSHHYDASEGQTYALRTLSPADYRQAAAGAFDNLTKKFGSSDPSKWRDKRQMYDQSALGAEQPPPMPFFDRGTYEELFELQSPGGAAATAHTRKRGRHHHLKRRRSRAPHATR
ncbi:MAG: penicillin acylase family protein [Thermoleophilaceae bacterium]